MDDRLRRLKNAPERVGLFLDFDGTLSEIVELPHEATPVEGARELLSALGERFAVVAVVSGRSAHQLLDWLGPGVQIWGVHGAETTNGSSVVLSEEAKRYVDLMQEARRYGERRIAGSGINGLLLEDKQVVLVLHYRAAADRAAAADAADELSREIADRYGLVRHEGRMSVELRPPYEFSKAGVVRKLAGDMQLGGAVFVGDDTVDLPAFDALDELADRGLTTLRVGVSSEEVPAELIRRADLVVHGPAGVIAFLQELLAAGDGGVAGSPPD